MVGVVLMTRGCTHCCTPHCDGLHGRRPVCWFGGALAPLRRHKARRQTQRVRCISQGTPDHAAACTPTQAQE